MYRYIWDEETGGLLLTTNISNTNFSKEPRPVYYKELDILGFDKHWNYPKDDRAPLMWAEANNYIYRGRKVASTKGGALYTPPELILLEEPEPDGQPLKFVDIEGMVKKNSSIMESLVQETIKKLYETYKKYKNKVDLFYVAFSGGKDSIVTLDIVQRALPHKDFVVIFGDTGMEFPDTYDVINKISAWCSEQKIKFFTAKSELAPADTWKIIGPPCSVTRWCCNVHKTSPQILLLRKLTKKPNFHGMAFVGVRGHESLNRSKYKYITYSGKHKGQYSCNSILDWSSSEVFLYIYKEKLLINEAYKKGNRRVGCLICPRAAEHNDFMNHYCYYNEAETFVNLIRLSYTQMFSSKKDLNNFILKGGWKARKNGRDINIPINYRESIKKNGEINIFIKNPKTDWKIWINTIGILINNESPYVVNFNGKNLSFRLEYISDEIHIFIDSETCQDNPYFIKLLKHVFRRAACCIACRECQADCPYGYLNFINGKVYLSDDCRHCAQCHNIEKGCLVYKSLEQPKGGIIVSNKSMSLNSYSHHAPKIDWIQQYFKFKNEFDNNHSLGSNMYSFFKRFLRDANLLDETGFSRTAFIIDNLEKGYENNIAWGIIFVNLSYAPQVNWYVKNIDFNKEYSKTFISDLMIEAGAKDTWTNDIFASLVRISELPMGNIGFGESLKEKNKYIGIVRKSWEEPEPLVILYSLYKFAEKCGDYYQFSLTNLLDDSIERDGVSPTRIFGLNRETMIPLLNGLSVNYPDFINVSFTLGLDTINLREDKKSEDVLNLF